MQLVLMSDLNLFQFSPELHYRTLMESFIPAVPLDIDVVQKYQAVAEGPLQLDLDLHV